MRSGSSEWPLVFFTLMIQMSVGFFVALSFFYDRIFIKNSGLITKDISDKIFLLIWPVIFLALVISFFHLGSPKNAVYVLSNISQSWLSREIFFTIIFSAFAFTAAFLQYKEIFQPQIRQIIISLSALTGLILIFVMSKLYMLETVPAWNSYNTPFSFFLSAMILGISSFLTLMTFLLEHDNKNIFFSSATVGMAKILLAICIALVFIELAMWLLHLKVLSGGIGASKESFNHIFSSHFFLSALRIILSALIIIFLLFALYGFSKNRNELIFVYLSYFLILIIEFSGRYLFYAMYARNGV